MQFRALRFLERTAIVIGLISLVLTRITTADPCPVYLPGAMTGLAEPSELTEPSGLAASRRNPRIIWTHNDNWNDQRLFALRDDGLLRSVWTVAASPPVSDPEDVAIGPGPIAGQDYLYFGDIGDNNNVRASIRVFRVKEPAVPWETPSTGGSLTGDVITLTYPDGPRDAETLMVDTNGDIYLIAKRVTPGRIYRAPYPQSITQANVLQAVGQVPGWGTSQITSGDIARDGAAIIIRGYSRITTWDRLAGETIATTFTRPGCDEPLVWEPQGEAICFGTDGREYFTLSEGVIQPIYHFSRLVQCITPLECDDGDPCTIDACDGFACAHTPMTADSDNDSVPDCADMCPDSPPGIPVDDAGCEITAGNIRLSELIPAMTAENPAPHVILLFDRNDDGKLDARDLPVLLAEIFE